MINYKKLLAGLSSLKNKVDKLDSGKLETTPVDFISKLSYAVKMMSLKRLNKMNNKHITTQEFNKFAAENFEARSCRKQNM